MTKIVDPILPQNFEIIRDTLGSIIKSELDNQDTLLPSENLSLPVFVNRLTPKRVDEDPFINLSYSGSNYQDNTTIQAVGDNIYYADVFTDSSATLEAAGDKTAAFLRDRIVGIIRAIIENPAYRTLGFDLPSINSVKVVSVETPDPLSRNNDAKNSTMARVVINVKMSETTELISANIIEGMKTILKLAETDEGFQYDPNFSE